MCLSLTIFLALLWCVRTSGAAQCHRTVVTPASAADVCPLASHLAWSQRPIIAISRPIDLDTREALYQTWQNGQAFPKELFYQSDSWENVSKESYQTADDLALLTRNIDRIIKYFRHSLIIELGPGLAIRSTSLKETLTSSRTFEKTEILLQTLEAQGIHRYFIAVDVSRNSLLRAAELNDKYHYITIVAIYSTFEDAIPFLHELDIRDASIMSIGSTVTNTPWHILLARLQALGRIASQLLLGQDGPPIDDDTIHSTYHTKAYQNLITTGLQLADQIIGEELFTDARQLSCLIHRRPYSHTFQFRLKNGQSFPAFSSIKYSESELREAFNQASFSILETFTHNTMSKGHPHIIKF